MSTQDPIVIVDDETDALLAVRATLASFKYSNIITCRSAEELFETIPNHGAQLILLDLVMPGVSGEEVLEKLSEDFPEVPVIMTTGIDDLKTVVRCIKKGAVDYLVKPIERELLKSAVEKAIRQCELERSTEALAESMMKKELSFPDAFSSIVTVDVLMNSIFKYIEAIAPTSHPILITGETGTGKELIARAIHTVSNRKGQMVAVNVGGFDETMLADALFGHEKGAFTGAEVVRKGMVERASNGTLFLDEIGELSIVSQVKLMRLLQEYEYQPLGADTVKRSNCRIITATSHSIEDLKNGGAFRKDLFYRLKTHHIHLPPLRERKGDIPLLVNVFLECAARELGKKNPTPPRGIYELLSTWHFPGNVRELKTLIYDAVARHEGRLMSLMSIKEAMGIVERKADRNNKNSDENSTVDFHEKLPTFKEAETLLLNEALTRTKGNKALAASLLGVSRSAVTQRLNKKSRQ